MKYATILGLLLVAALTLTGCGQPAGTPKDGEKKDAGKKADGKKADGKKAEHTPHGKGPNGGVVFDLGKYHAEIDIKHPKKEMIILILGNDEKTPVAIACKELTVVTKETKSKKGDVVKPMTVTLKPADEKDGKATKFVGTDPGLEPEAEHEGTVVGEIDGKSSKGEFKE